MVKITSSNAFVVLLLTVTMKDEERNFYFYDILDALRK